MLPASAAEPGQGEAAKFERSYLVSIIDHHYSALRMTELAAGTDWTRDATVNNPLEGTSPTPEFGTTPARSTDDEIRSLCAGIHMSDIPSFPYSLPWGERTLRSVTNLTRADGLAFFRIAAECPLVTEVTVFPLNQANLALAALREGAFDGAAVLVP